MPILYADDEPEDLQRWSGILKLRDNNLKSVSTYEEADLLLRSGGFDLLVVDLYLNDPAKGMTGLKLAREHGKSVPVIILTAFGKVEAAVEALKRYSDAPAAVDFVEKGGGPQPLLRAVDNALRRRVFVVHGHDVRSLFEVTDFLEAKGLWPIVLSNQPGLGRTIIQKFEDSSNVSFAVVLLTPDDLGGLRSDQLDALKPRPRQNVVFELGFFIGKLGRARVAALCEDHETLEIPSNFTGVQFISKDSQGEWRKELAKEMRAAGVPVG